jgi:hypothetical protein
MIKNNWLTTSLCERSENNLCDFTMTINPYPFKQDTFENNSNRVAKEICNMYDKVYIMYSGGLDSEHALKVFLENKLPVTPIIVVTPYNKRELVYAVKFCKQHNIKPEIVIYEKYELFEKIIKRTKPRGYYSLMSGINFEICDIVSNKGGKLVTGTGEPFSPIRSPNITEETDTIEFCEWDFYIDQYDATHPSGFHTYDLELHYSMLTDVEYTGDMQKTKSQLYGLEYRQKIYWDSEFYKIFNAIRPNVKQYKVNVNTKAYKDALLANSSTTFK